MLRFSRPKGPGFGISAGFYLSVLSSRSVLPPILQVINPKGEGGAVTGFGVPMAAGATKETLAEPMQRGIYGFASKDRKTALDVRVFSKDEAGFDTETVARHSETLGIAGELLNRIRGTWNLIQVRFESHDPMVYPALDFTLAVVSRLGFLSDGAIADPVSQRYLLPEDVFARPRVNPLVDAREHVAIHRKAGTSGIQAHTKGLQKFALHELEILSLTPGSELSADRLLLSAAQSVLEGKLLTPGQRVGRFQVAEGGFDRSLWEGIPCFELLPPTAMTASEALNG
jgi:hypothetical protein